MARSSLDEQVVKEVSVNKINKKKSIRKTKDPMAIGTFYSTKYQTINEESTYDDAYDRGKWRDFVM